VRTLVSFSLGTEASNRALRDGSLPKLIETFMRDYKPEAAYFFHQRQRRARGPVRG
jgi:hypothetical protein